MPLRHMSVPKLPACPLPARFTTPCHNWAAKASPPKTEGLVHVRWLRQMHKMYFIFAIHTPAGRQFLWDIHREEAQVFY